jgi:hypothetical protein
VFRQHEKTSSQVRALRLDGAEVVAFARLGEKSEAGRTQAFLYLGPLEFVDWWGDKPVHFTWRLRAFPSGVSGTPELDALAEWKPRPAQAPLRPAVKSSEPLAPGSSGRALAIRMLKEGAKSRVTANRYERDPVRARSVSKRMAAHVLSAVLTTGQCTAASVPDLFSCTTGFP